MKPPDIRKRELLDLWIAIVIAFGFAFSNMAVDFVGDFKSFFENCREAPLFRIASNIIFLMIGGMLWFAYVRWKKLDKRQFELEDVIDSVNPDVLLVADGSESVTMCNKAVKSMFGYEPREVVGRKVDMLFPSQSPEECWAEMRRDLEREGSCLGLETGIKKDGGSIPLEVIAGRLSGRRGAVMLLRDITERKRAEKLLKQRSDELEAANSELEAFSYSVSHDLRAPLRSMDGFSQVLLEDYGDKVGDEGRSCLERVRRASRHMEELISDMLKLSRVTRREMKRETVNLSEMVMAIAGELTEAEPQRDVEFIVEPDVTVEGDAHLLRVALHNLLGNAWKFTGKKSNAKIEFGVTQPDDEKEYFVRDNGAGFDMAYADKLFGAFQRLHSAEEFAGTGIGLATVQRVIRRHGGRIRAESDVGRGATFYFTLGEQLDEQTA